MAWFIFSKAGQVFNNFSRKGFSCLHPHLCAEVRECELRSVPSQLNKHHVEQRFVVRVLGQRWCVHKFSFASRCRESTWLRGRKKGHEVTPGALSLTSVQVRMMVGGDERNKISAVGRNWSGMLCKYVWKKKIIISVIPPDCEASVMQFYRYLNLFLPSE